MRKGKRRVCVSSVQAAQLLRLRRGSRLDLRGTGTEIVQRDGEGLADEALGDEHEPVEPRDEGVAGRRRARHPHVLLRLEHRDRDPSWDSRITGRGHTDGAGAQRRRGMATVRSIVIEVDDQSAVVLEVALDEGTWRDLGEGAGSA